MPELRRAIETGDASGAERLAHAMKGSVANFCAPAATNAAQRVETLAANGDQTPLRAALSDLEHELERLEPELLALKG